MKILNLISTRWVLIMVFALIGSATLFTACQQESMDDLAPLETAIDSSVDDRSGYQFVDTETPKVSGWKPILNGNRPDLVGKDVKIEITPDKRVSTINVYARPTGRLLKQLGLTNAEQTKTVEILKSQLQGNETHIEIYTWADGETKYTVKMYARGGGVTPPTGTDYQFVDTVTPKVSGWKPILNGNRPDLVGKDVKIEITPDKRVSTINVYARPTGRLLKQLGLTNAEQTKTVEILKSQLQGNETHIEIYTWADGETKYTVTMYARGSGGGTPPTGSSVFPTGFVIGLEAGDVINRNNGNNSMFTKVNDNKNRYQYLQESGAKFVRVNFFKPKNYTGSDFGWMAKYDAIINDLRNKNLPIYAVVTDVVGGASGGGETSYPTLGNHWQQRAWIDKYAAAFKAITTRYKGKITHYESFNEPNNWIPNHNVPAMTHDDFAYLLKKTSNTVKANGNPNNITLISGPVIAHDAGQNGLCPFTGPDSKYNNGACYLGKAIESNGGVTFFDAVGYHIYVAQRSGDPASGVQKSADALKNMLQAKGLNKDTYVSEIGWDSNKISATAQVNSIEQGLNKLRSLKNSHRIKGVCLFSLSDFQTATIIEKYGLVTPDYMNNGNGFEKAAWFKFKNMNKGN